MKQKINEIKNQNGKLNKINSDQKSQKEEWKGSGSRKHSQTQSTTKLSIGSPLKTENKSTVKLNKPVIHKNIDIEMDAPLSENNALNFLDNLNPEGQDDHDNNDDREVEEVEEKE